MNFLACRQLHSLASITLSGLRCAHGVCAAYRGLESEEEDALYRDPLAIALAGHSAMQDARQQSPVQPVTRRST